EQRRNSGGSQPRIAAVARASREPADFFALEPLALPRALACFCALEPRAARLVPAGLPLALRGPLPGRVRPGLFRRRCPRLCLRWLRFLRRWLGGLALCLRGCLTTPRGRPARGWSLT